MKATSLALAAALVLSAGASPVAAQEATGPASTPSPMCGVLTDADIQAVLGKVLPVTRSGDLRCGWDDYASGGEIGVWVSLSHIIVPLSVIESADDGTRTEIAGSPAVIVTSPNPRVYVETNGGILEVGAYLQGADPSLDVPSTLMSLARAAMGRISSIELPPPPSPFVPSVVGDPELAALFPKTVDGQSLGGFMTLSSEQWLQQYDPDDPDSVAHFQPYQDVVATQGKTLTDISVGVGYFGGLGRFGQIYALRVRGADIAAMTDGLLPLEWPIPDPVITPIEIAGRSVLSVGTGEPYPRPMYVYPKDDILWMVRQEAEPDAILSEVFSQLP